MSLWVDNTEIFELRPNASEEDLQTVIRAVYRQVLGNQHVMDSQTLTSAESFLRDGMITVKGFVRMVAKSDLYQSLFFETSSPYRFVELNCKHLLGRAPIDQAEISAHVQTYNNEGYGADIDSYLDSEEYNANFGENVVPYARGASTQAGFTNATFNRTFALMRGYAANDGAGAKLISAVAANIATKISTPATGTGATDNTGKRFRVTITKANFGPRVTRSAQTFEVGYAQLSRKIQNIQKTGGKVVSITEVA
ncbi:MAG: photosystem I reaction center subunit XII [Merismopedia sp. SIO2A8]|nr:photosystem I reaction center subunit XII [Merismopedia sp. SIO2A8]